MPTLNTQIDIVKKALTGKLIAEATDKELSNRLSLVYMLIGLRPQHFPTQEQDVFIFNYIRSHYGQKTLDEITLAFDKAIQGELDIDDVKVYDQFTIEYFVRIMNGYRQWMKKVHQVAMSRIKEIEQEVKTDIMQTSKQEKLDDIAEWEAKKEINFNFIPPYLYDYLCEVGKIIHTKEDKIDIYERACNVRYHELKQEAEGRDKSAIADYNKFSLMYKKGYKHITGEEVRRIRNIAKKIGVYEYLKDEKRINSTKA